MNGPASTQDRFSLGSRPVEADDLTATGTALAVTGTVSGRLDQLAAANRVGA